MKTNQQQTLVKYLLPSHIRDKFLQNPSSKLDFTEEFQQVTILYADIAGFTKYSAGVSSEQVVTLLRNLFEEFDKLCLTNNVYKLYTIGDCYVAIGLVDAFQRNPEQEAKNIVDFSFELLDVIEKVKWKINFDELNMRIGIHTGKIIGGIIGTNIVRYDIYGPDVLIANKMESEGSPGFINISENTKAILEQKFDFAYYFQKNKDIEIKSLDKTIETHFIFKNLLYPEANS